MNLKPVAGAIAILALLSSSGCADIPRQVVPLQIAKPSDTLKTEIDQSGEAQLYLDTGYLATNAYNISAFDPGDPLPDVVVDRVSLTEAGIYQAMNLMTKNTDLTVSIMGGADAAARYGAVSVMNVKGKLSSVVERLSQSMGFFYSVNGKHLLIEPERQFFIEVPPALNDDNAAGMANTLQALGARDIYLDRSNRTLVLRVNRTGYDRIARYLKKVREERAMIVYEVSIFQVDLKDQNDTGVQWNKLGWAANGMIPATPSVGAGTGTGAGTVGGGTGNTAGQVASMLTQSLVASQATGYGLGMVLNSSKFTIDSLVTFLQTQGTVKSLSSPRIAMLAGTKGSIRVGNTLTYVSKIGSNTTVGLSQISTETKDLRTGLDLALFGEVHDNTVYSRVSLSLSELVRMTSAVTLGNEQKLPETAEREIKTEIRARPGDMILLGGVTVDRSSFDVNRGLMVNGSSKQAARSELVVALKPKLVHFQTKDQVQEARAENEARHAALAQQVAPVVAAQVAPQADLDAVVSSSLPSPVLANSLAVEPVAAQAPVQPVQITKAPVLTKAGDEPSVPAKFSAKPPPSAGAVLVSSEAGPALAAVPAQLPSGAVAVDESDGSDSAVKSVAATIPAEARGTQRASSGKPAARKTSSKRGSKAAPVVATDEIAKTEKQVEKSKVSADAVNKGDPKANTSAEAKGPVLSPEPVTAAKPDQLEQTGLAAPLPVTKAPEHMAAKPPRLVISSSNPTEDERAAMERALAAVDALASRRAAGETALPVGGSTFASAPTVAQSSISSDTTDTKPADKVESSRSDAGDKSFGGTAVSKESK